MIKHIFSVTLLAFGILLASTVFGCIGVSDTRGNLPLAEVVEEIKPGRHTQREIISMLGSPSTKATYEEQEFWYYIGEKTETLIKYRGNEVWLRRAAKSALVGCKRW